MNPAVHPNRPLLPSDVTWSTDESSPRTSTFPLDASYEAKLALCCAGVVVSGLDTAKVHALLGQPIDWHKLVGFANRHGILPLVHECLSSSCAAVMSADVARELRLQFQANAMRNRFLARELVRLTALLERAGVETIAFKGPALAISAYGTLSLRQFIDLDLLVRENHSTQAVTVLSTEGYVMPAGYSIGQIGRAGSFETSMVNPRGFVCIDLHWRLAEPYFPLAMDGEDLWQRAARVGIEDGAVATLGIEDHLLYLCAHGARHGWETLGGICDVARLVRSPQLDWDRVVARAELVGARRMLLLGILLAHDLLDAPVPERLLDSARRKRAVLGSARTFVRYAADPPPDGPGLYQRWSVPLRMIERPAARMRYLAARALLPGVKDHESVSLPLALAPLYYVLRPLRIALREGRAALRRLRVPDAPAADHPGR